MATYLKRGKSEDAIAASDIKVKDTVYNILKDVEENGDAAVRKLSQQFDNWSPDSFKLSRQQIEEVINSLPKQVVNDIKFAQKQIRFFAQQQRASILDIEVETLPGIILGHKNIPVNSAGCYIPGGRYPMVASAHMSILTAKVAGVQRVIACTPAIKGELPAATICAMHLAGADEIYLLGGVQAVC